MTIATDFTRDDCQLGQRRVTYAKLQREYRCNDCGGRPTLKYDGGVLEGWRVECGACGAVDFIHECELQRQHGEAVEVIGGLPPELLALMGIEWQEEREPRLLKLGQKPAEI